MRPYLLHSLLQPASFGLAVPGRRHLLHMFVRILILYYEASLQSLLQPASFARAAHAQRCLSYMCSYTNTHCHSEYICVLLYMCVCSHMYRMYVCSYIGVLIICMRPHSEYICVILYICVCALIYVVYMCALV